MTALNQAFGIWASVQQAVMMGCELASVDLDQFRVNSENPDESARVIIHKLNNNLRSSRCD